MRSLCCIAVVSFLLVGVGAAGRAGQASREEVLEVGASETLLVGPDDAHVMMLDRWIMGDNATIEIAQEVGALRIYAKEVSLGSNVRIVGRGRNGTGGSDGHSFGAARQRERGRGGTRGGPGSSGKDGKHVEIIMGLRSVGSLHVDVGGGSGGNGGRGGNGGKGGEASCNRGRGRNGGNGGPGGAGGAGGSGGNVSIRFWPNGDSLDIGAMSFDVTGGDGGRPGDGGSPGAGGDGRRCPPSGPIIYRRGGGSAGRAGSMGAEGERGSAGSRRLELTAPVSLDDASRYFGGGVG